MENAEDKDMDSCFRIFLRCALAELGCRSPGVARPTAGGRKGAARRLRRRALFLGLAVALGSDLIRAGPFSSTDSDVATQRALRVDHARS